MKCLNLFLISFSLTFSTFINAASSYSPESCRSLFEAVEKGHHKKAKELVGSGVLVTCVDSQGWTPLHKAIQAQDEKMVEILLSSPLALNLDDYSDNWPLVHYACLIRNVTILRMLLKAGASPHTALKIHVDGKIFPVIRLARTVYGLTPLHVAIYEGASDCVFQLLMVGGSSLAKFRVSFFLGRDKIYSGLDLARFYDRGNVRQAFENFKKVQQWAEREIWQSCNSGPTKGFEKALNSGLGQFTKSKQGWSPLHVAAYHGQIETIETLVNQGFYDPSAKGPSNLTPLHVASFFGKLDAVETLLRLGAALNARAASHGLGEFCYSFEVREIGFYSKASPLGMATLGRHADVAQFLVSVGAKFNHSEGLLARTFFWKGKRRKEFRGLLKKARAASGEERKSKMESFKARDLPQAVKEYPVPAPSTRRVYGNRTPSAPLLELDYVVAEALR